jgi:hypothetical protein
MSDIPDEAYSAAKEIAQCYEDIRELKALLARAADALESPAWEWHRSWALAKELRKTAQS